MNGLGVRALLVVIALLFGTIAGLIMVALARSSGAPWSTAVARGAVSFGGTTTLVILIENQFHS